MGILILTLSILVIFLISFFIGAVPFATVVGVGWFKVDVRDFGSGNTGTTNVIRVLGWKPGLVVFFLDVAKGAFATLVSLFMAILLSNSEPFAAYLTDLSVQARYIHIYIMLLIGPVGAVAGHVFSPYLKFHGGKGVATGLGTLLVIAPIPGLCALGVFVVVALITRYASLGSVLAGISLPIFVLLFESLGVHSFFETEYADLIYAIFITVTLLITHRKNLARLAHHEESKISFHKGSKTAGGKVQEDGGAGASLEQAGRVEGDDSQEDAQADSGFEQASQVEDACTQGSARSDEELAQESARTDEGEA